MVPASAARNMKTAGEGGVSESAARERANNTKPGKATVRMPQRSIMRPRIGVASALVNAANESAKETVERRHCMSAAIGLRKTPEVNKRTGPLHTVRPATAPKTTHHRLVIHAGFAGCVAKALTLPPLSRARSSARVSV